MTVDQWRRLGRLFHEVQALDRGERSAFIADACRDDAVLREEIESLLIHEADAGGFLETPGCPTPPPKKPGGPADVPTLAPSGGR